MNGAIRLKGIQLKTKNFNIEARGINKIILPNNLVLASDFHLQFPIIAIRT